MTNEAPPPAPPRSQIADYAIIGDLETAALVSRTGSVDWLCWPRFDSDACFAALLGDDSHGCWRLAPAADFTVTRRYRPGTLILETLFETAEGTVAVLDLMPPRSDVSHVVRIVEGRRGLVPMRMRLVIRFGYGRAAPWVRRIEDQTLCAIAGPSMTVLRTPVETRGEGLTTVAEFVAREGEATPFVLSHQASHLSPPAPIDAEAAMAETERFWRSWLGAGVSAGPYAEAIERSKITLKAMTFAPTGGLVAAPTTSLPEQFGGERNWDYRYCWIRDSTLTLLAMMNNGHYEEAEAWRAWLQRAVAGAPQDLQIMYGIGGERRLMEWTADWLPGHEGSRPVRIGNAAHEQFQLDVFGELLDTFHQARRGGVADGPDLWGLELALVDHVAKVWNEPDEGIWEIRGPKRRFTYSRVMAWVAVDRAIRSAEDFGLEGPLEDWRALREALAADVWANGFDAARNTFVQAYGEPQLDASLLLLAQVGFLAPSHPAYVGTVEAIERELLVNGFVQRYRTRASVDGLPPGEGAFLACSFWLADAYALIGRPDDARRLFERLLGVRNDVGLLSEEYDVRGGRLAGNFPQAFSHIALINTAANLTHATKPSEQRTRKDKEP
ncbi:MAG: glycoside hydrolase family 15 protein [Caulobacteraceae bacterium]|nr:glycoside hydrolase family 15 protein [Caulobacteraceae bacterium]